MTIAIKATPSRRSAAAVDARPGARRLGFAPGLEGLRGIAVLLVVLHHSLFYFFPSLYGHWFPGAWLGVDVFFVLSGFLITTLLLEERHRTGSVGFGGFYSRRARRLLPALYVLIVAQFLFAVIARYRIGDEWSTVWPTLVYATNTRFSLTGGVPGLGHLWSLAVEEQFYLLWPILLVGLLLIRRSRLVPLVLVAAVVAIGAHRAELWQHHVVWLWLYARTDARADALLIGALTAWCRRGRQLSTTAARVLGVVGAAVLVGCILTARADHGFIYMGGFTLIAVAAAFVVIATVESPAGILTARPTRAVGRVSYGLYLWHAFVFVAVVHWTQSWPAAPRLGVALGIAALATILSWRFVERPFLRRRASGARRAVPDADHVVAGGQRRDQ